MGNVDWGDSDGGERLWLSDTKTDPQHPVQTNQSPLYIAKSCIVHSAHCVVHLSCVNQPVSALHCKIIHCKCTCCTLYCTLVLCKPANLRGTALHNTISACAHKPNPFCTSMVHTHCSPRALHTCEFSVCANQPISVALVYNEDCCLSFQFVHNSQQFYTLNTLIWCTYVSSQTVQINQFLIYFMYILQSAHCGSMEVSTRQALQCIAVSFVCPPPV